MNRWNIGSHLAVPGDLDGDGLNELVLAGATDIEQADNGSQSGGAYVIFGRNPWPARVRLDDEIQAGTTLFLSNAACGRSVVAGPGDLNGDGLSDLVLGYPACTGSDAKVRLYLDGLRPEENNPEPSSVITGDPTPIPLYHEGFPVRRTPRAFGAELSPAGDLNGDGRLDFIVGAGHFQGAFYLVLGADWNFLGASINELEEAGLAVVVNYEHQVGYFGEHAAGIGDFNGDGLDDAVVGSPAGGRDFNGEAFIIFGSLDLGRTIREVNVLRDGSERVMRISGESSYDWTGYVAALGDVNDDGFTDVGLTGDDHRNTVGRAYVVFGARETPAELSLSKLGQHGFRLIGSEGNWLSGHNGGMASGDFDGDGLRDLAVGEATPKGKRAIVIFGKRHGSGNFIRADANADGKVDLSDAVFVLGYLFLGGAKFPACEDAADADDSGKVEITDAIYLLGHLFLGTAPPPSPFPEAGKDPTLDSLACTGP